MTLREQISDQDWLVEESGFNPARQSYRETIFTVGNGYQGTRGTLEEGALGAYAATYLAGVFDHHDSTVIDMVNSPSWLPLSIRVDGERLDVHSCTVLEHRQALDLRQGLLYRLTRFEDSQGRRTSYESVRYASLADRHLCGIHALVSAENYSGRLSVESGIDGVCYNLDRLPKYVGEPDFHPEVQWEKWAKSKHLEFVTGTDEEDAVYLECKTIDTQHRLGYAAALQVSGADARREFRLDNGRVGEIMEFDVVAGQTVTLDKLVAIHTSRDVAAEEVKAACLDSLRRGAEQGFASRLAEHAARWSDRWADSDCLIDGDPRSRHAVRFNVHHLVISANENDPRANIGAKTMSGEGYKGHVFWDTEIFILPFFIYTHPQTARALLTYRYHTMQGALTNAQTNGFQGAQYAWESADTGLETTPKWTADGSHRIWTGEEEIHITADVAYGVETYLTATGDLPFFFDCGAEMLFNTARFWVSRLEHDKARDRFELSRVIGPDEFHEHVDNNVYTNWMARWNLQIAAQRHAWLRAEHGDVCRRVEEALALTDQEVAAWREIAGKVYTASGRDDRLIEQHQGYFDCKAAPITQFDENNMPVYPDGYDAFNAGETTLVKQPDVVMLMYVLPDEFDDETKRINYDYYEERTMHKSSLSPCIHSIMGIEVGDTHKAMQYFLRSALVDLDDNQGNTEWGLHAASMGGTWMSVVFGFGGFRVKNRTMTFKPWLPEGWRSLGFRLQWHGRAVTVRIEPHQAAFDLESQLPASEDIIVGGKAYTLVSGETLTVPF